MRCEAHAQIAVELVKREKAKRMTRREFVGSATFAGSAALAAVSAGALSAAGAVAAVSRKTPAGKPRNRRPYTGLDWSKVMRVKTTSHGHCKDQSMLDLYLKRGFEFLTMSNYYPSAPWCPASKMTENYYRLHHDHPVMVNGRRVDGPFDWNKIIEPWKDKIDAKAMAKKPAWAARYPFVEGKKLFKPLPPGVLEAPNAEHHNFLLENGKPAWALHICSPGSLFASGTFDAHNLCKTASHGYNFGSGEFWGTAIDRMIEGLIYPDGGGVTINHPSWTKLDRELMLKILDHDPRVLGIEALECGGFNSEDYWDWALSTGRQCFGFFVPDWSIAKKSCGVNVLCVQEKTVHACLKAYREGNFYGATNGYDELAFTRIAFDGRTVTAATDKPARFEVITARGVVKEQKGKEVAWTVEDEKYLQGPGLHVFARVKAYAVDGSEEVLFSQPFMLKD